MTEFTLLYEADKSNAGFFLCWPRFEEEQFTDRVSQLEGLGITAIAFGGPHAVRNKPILGKGHVGVVIRAIHGEEEVALKCMRTDSDRETMSYEARLLKRANEAGLGPRLLTNSRDFIVMEKIVGAYLGDWVKENLDKPHKVRDILVETIQIARRLDLAGIDHGELTKVRRHYIVTDSGVRVIDFESASLGRATQNLTCTVQSMFLRTKFAQMISGIHELPDKKELIQVLSSYKDSPGEEEYEEILRVLRFS